MMSISFFILIVSFRSHVDNFYRHGSRQQHGNNQNYPANFEDHYPFLRNNFLDEKDPVNEINRIVSVLPDWVQPCMVYPESSIKTTKVLGHGQYGQVQQGIFRHGNAV